MATTDLLETGDDCPAFTLPTAGGGSVSAADLKGKMAVIYFYPRADTPGCTVQATDFTAMLDDFEAAGATVVGISKDPVAKLEKFAAKRGLGIVLASDEDSDVCERFGVWKEKNMYGKTYMGIERSTFLIDADGKVAEVWRKVRAKDHAEAVLERIREG